MGRSVKGLDPVRAYLLKLRTPMPADTLRAVAEEILPGVRRQRLTQIGIVVFGFVFVFGGNYVYFRFVSTWKGLDPVLVSIYALQVLVMLSGPILAFRMARRRYASRIGQTLLKYRHCPHCAYDIRGLPTHEATGTTICPECGCAWHINDANTTEEKEP